MDTMKTRDKILNTALTLFNKSGTAAISTNHIAEAAGISPGNLYYHFHNKEEIIRSLFEQLYSIWDEGFSFSSDHTLRLEDLNTIVQYNYQIIWEYRFAYRELVALLRQDTELHNGFLKVRQRGYDGFVQLFQAFVSAGVLRMPEDPQAVDELMNVCWLISEFWITNLEISGHKVNEDEMQRGVHLMLHVLQPHIAQGE